MAPAAFLMPLTISSRPSSHPTKITTQTRPLMVISRESPKKTPPPPPPPVPPVSKTTKPQDPLQRGPLPSQTPQWKSLEKHAREIIDKTHLRELMKDEKRVKTLSAEFDGILLDYSRQRVVPDTMRLLYELAERMGLKEKIMSMFNGDKINTTEKRSVLHMMLRAKRGGGKKVIVDGVDVIEDVWGVLERIRRFSGMVRSGEWRGFTGKELKKFVVVGIGGSYLGPEFVYEALMTDEVGWSKGQGDGREVHFLSNVDPVDVKRVIKGFKAEETLVVVVSKTFTTRETVVNAKTMRDWLWECLGRDKEVVMKHMVACSSNVEAAEKFGIDADNVFEFWDWVGGRYSVCSSVGALPLSLQYGFDTFERFLEGARSMDQHFVRAPFERNLPVLLGLLGVWNMSFMDYKTRAMHPYTEALLKFPSHIQQVDMESNGKHVTRHGDRLDFEVGEVDFGEPGTQGQHSFFQLLHMGQVVPCDFIGFIESQNPICEEGEPVSNHDELMSNFFAQPDALANGKTAEECRAEGRPEWLIPHVTFEGNRPSLSLLLPVCNAYVTGQLLALYEHRTAVEGFVWDINSFDQWGVELGKVLATKVRKQLNQSRYHAKDVEGFNSSTTRLIERYLQSSVGCAFEDPIDDQ